MVAATARAAERLPAPSAREPRVPMALSFGAHAVLLLPLMLAGAPRATPSSVPAPVAEYALVTPASEAESFARPAAKPEPEVTLELPPPEEPPPPKLAESKRPEPAKPRRAAAAKPVAAEMPARFRLR